MLSGNYWDKVVQRRISRRRAVAGAAGFGLSAAALGLIGCGDGDDDGSGSSGDSGASGLLHKPSVSTGKAGGTLKHYDISDASHFDAVADSNAAVVRQVASTFYPRLLRMNQAEYPNEADGGSQGEAADTWEISPDRLTVTFKLRQPMLWDRRAPTNGRQIDA
jgi:ABC-type oligopeptide transport system substrate-binding subunit